MSCQTLDVTVDNSLYFLYFLFMQHWVGPLEPQSPNQPWPAPRCLHATSCVVDPDSEIAALHQKVVTFWGKGSDNKYVPDIWMLDVATVTWREVSCLYKQGLV